jgi:hypothetical protein
MCVLFMFVITIAFSQEANNPSPPFTRKKLLNEFAIYGGPSLGFLRGSAPVETNEVYTRRPWIGYTLGISLTHNFSERIALEALLLWEKKGGSVTFVTSYFNEATQTMENADVRNDYVFTTYSMPLFLRYLIGKKKQSAIGIGPYASYLKKQIVENSTSYGARGFWDETEFNKDMEWGVAMLASHRLQLTEGFSLRVTLMNTLGITDIRDPNYFGPVRTNNTTVLLGFVF